MRHDAYADAIARQWKAKSILVTAFKRACKDRYGAYSKWPSDLREEYAALKREAEELHAIYRQGRAA